MSTIPKAKIAENKKPASEGQSTPFLNQTGVEYEITLRCLNKIGLISRVTQVFNRRGFGIKEFSYNTKPKNDFSSMRILVTATRKQIRIISHEISKLIEVKQLEYSIQPPSSVWKQFHHEKGTSHEES